MLKQLGFKNDKYEFFIITGIESLPQTQIF